MAAMKFSQKGMDALKEVTNTYTSQLMVETILREEDNPELFQKLQRIAQTDKSGFNLLMRRYALKYAHTEAENLSYSAMTGTYDELNVHVDDNRITITFYID